MAIITYIQHPALELGKAIDNDVATAICDINSLQESILTAKDKLNNLNSAYNRILLVVDSNEQTEEPVQLANIKKSISEAQASYRTIAIESENQILAQMETLSSKRVEFRAAANVLDEFRCNLVSCPSYMDSLIMDSQYFSFESGAKRNQIGQFTSSTISSIFKDSHNIEQRILKQIERQSTTNELVGSLVIVASCCHHNMHSYQYMALDESVAKSLSNNNKLHVVSGAVYGSAFVGILYFIKQSAQQLQPKEVEQKIEIGSWLQSLSGSFGVSPTILNEIESQILGDKITMSVGYATIGLYPSMGGDSYQGGYSANANSLISIYEDYLASVRSIEYVGGVPIAYAISEFDTSTAEHETEVESEADDNASITEQENADS